MQEKSYVCCLAVDVDGKKKLFAALIDQIDLTDQCVCCTLIHVSADLSKGCMSNDIIKKST